MAKFWALLLLGLQLLAWLYYFHRRWGRRALAGPSLILYASQSGQGRHIAEKLAKTLAFPCHGLDELASQLEQLQGRQLIIIASTTGTGDPPDNGRKFIARLRQQVDLAGTRYHLLALGDRRYEDFCHFGKMLDEALQMNGALPASPLTLVDNLNEETLQRWQAQLATALNQELAGLLPETRPATLLERRLLNPGSEFPLYYLGLSCELPEDCALVELRVPGPAGPVGRQYSVAGFGLNGAANLHLLVRWQRRPDGSGGLASTYLTQHWPVGDTLPLLPLEHPVADLPVEPVPLILLASGSGLAGLLGVLEKMERRFPAQKHRLKHWLIFGERSSERDNIYGEPLAELQQRGVIGRLDRCFSRGGDRRYVQQLLAANGDELRTLLAAGAHIYICGSSQRLGSGCGQVLVELLGAAEYQRLQEEQRLHFDTY